MLNNHAAWKYEIPYKVPFVITGVEPMEQSDYNMVQYKSGIIYVGLSHINLIQILKILTSKICVRMSTYDHQLYSSVLYWSLDTSYIIGLFTKTLVLIHIGSAHEFFMTKSFSPVTIVGDALKRRGS